MSRGMGSWGWKAEAGVFLVVAFVAAGLFGAVQPATGIPPEVVQLTQFGPAAGVLALAALWPARIRRRLAGVLRAAPDAAGPSSGGASGARSRARWLLPTAPLIIAVSAGGYALVHDGPVSTDPRTLSHPFLLVVVAQLLGACGEEIGWRCLLQPLLRTRFGPLTAPVLVGLVWGVWHVGVFAQAPAYAAGFLTATVALSVVLGLALERIRAGRLLLAGGFHALVNLGMLLFMDEESGAVAPMLLFGAACLAAAALWTVRAGARAPGVTIAAARHGAL
ncbi:MULTISPECIES: CPBP family intramembrane glutamic endopeptidase [unclassified Streptomyces]|uniref:CPBP family intramembrane glutamic endopeptidase n=1 Tax=unclassified Streptomyces TaxID=2593676 RepID=UPI002E2F17A0|nr:CPBP family intramembrane glutamic endopeptidase [Streptomyces sp. NBC_01268]